MGGGQEKQDPLKHLSLLTEVQPPRMALSPDWQEEDRKKGRLFSKDQLQWKQAMLPVPPLAPAWWDDSRGRGDPILSRERCDKRIWKSSPARNCL